MRRACEIIVAVVALAGVVSLAGADRKDHTSWWRNFTRGKRLGEGVRYGGIVFPTEKCATRFGTGGKVAKKDRRAFGDCLSAYLARSEDPFKCCSGNEGDAYFESDVEEGIMRIGGEGDRLWRGPLFTIVVWNKADAKQFIRDHVPKQVTPSKQVIAAMKLDGVTRIAMKYEFCVDTDGELKSTSITQSSGYQDFDFDVAGRVWRDQPAYAVDGIGTEICDEIEFSYSLP